MVAQAMTSRERFLARVRDARGTLAAPTVIARTYRREGVLTADERAALFCTRVLEYGARVEPTNDVAALVESTCARRIAVPRDVPDAWLPPGVERVDDDGLTPYELDAVDGVLTGSTVAIAETGTIVLTGRGEEGRRAISLIPDLHVCVVRDRDIVELVPEAVDRLKGIDRPITLVSGPSATCDIELQRVEGVHGPRRLVVAVVSSLAADDHRPA
jgi:L-lactate dehydrogenase complex protein LldG